MENKKCAGIVAVVFIVCAGIVMMSLYVSQCVVGDSNSLTITAEEITLKGKPTDNVFLGWESLFGKPKDEIRVEMRSGICFAGGETHEMGQGQTKKLGHSVNTFFTFPFQFQLVEDDGGFEGKDDLSKTHKISKDDLNAIKEYLQDKDVHEVVLNYHVTVKGQNFFQENELFGFIAQNLCISVLDFVTGPYGRVAKKLPTNLLLKKLGKTNNMLYAKDVAKLYKEVGSAYQNGILNKKQIFKGVAAYQLKRGAQDAVMKPFTAKMSDYVKQFALDQTKLDEEIKKTFDEVIHGVQKTGTQEEYNTVTTAMEEWGNVMAEISDKMEFCLSEVLPPSRDALYYVKLTVKE